MGRRTYSRTIGGIVCLILILVLLCASLSVAGKAAAATSDSTPVGATTFAGRFGIADSHLPLHSSSLAHSVVSKIKSTGAGWVRCVFAWSDMQPFEGQAINFTGTDRAVNEAQDHGVKVLGILGFTPGWANGGNALPIYPPAADHVTDWQAYVTAVSTRYRGKVSAWEIWNEENIDQFWQPSPDASAYMTLVKATSPMIRAADPAAKIVMGGLAGLGSDFMDACLNAGIADYVDAIAYHPYVETVGPPIGYAPKESLCRTLVSWVRSLIAEHTAKRLEIWITEFGWTTYDVQPDAYPPGVSQSTQASYMLRSLINYADTDVDRVIWYDAFDEESNYADYFGLLHNDLTAKASYNYYRTFESVFGRATARATGIATFKCSAPETLETHAFSLSDGSLVLGAWKSDDAGDWLTFTLNDPTYSNAVVIDPNTGTSSQAPGVSRASDGKLTVASAAIGKKPVIFKFTRTSTAAMSWYLAEGTTDWGFDTYISIQNPGSNQATADLTYMTKAGPVKGPSVNLAPQSQATVYPRATLGSTDFSTKVTCREGRQIVVDRTMTWTGRGAPSPEAHSAIAVTSPATTWYLPEGSSDWGFECWLLIQNPNSKSATCTVTYMVEGVGPKHATKTIPANSRASFNMADDIGAADASIKVEASVPVIPERAMYRNNRREGHDSTGTTSPSREYYLAEGTTDWGFKTYVLVQNPNNARNTVTVTYMTPEGPVKQDPFTMPANSRKTIEVNSVVPAKDLSTHVHGSLPLIAERAMYWGGNTALGEACHDSIGISEPHSTFYLPDGQSSSGHETWTLVQNPNGKAVDVEITYMTPTGAGNVTFSDTVPANSRKSYSMGDMLPGSRASIMVHCKTAGNKIIVERAMYWNTRGAGTDTIGGFSD